MIYPQDNDTDGSKLRKDWSEDLRNDGRKIKRFQWDNYEMQQDN